MIGYRPFRVYSTWGFHDELGDTVEITEELCNRALDCLEIWQSEHGLKHDYFHFDAFWFDRECPFNRFSRKNFPNGHEALFERIASLGLKPGLWYSTNGHQMEVPEWADCKAVNEPCYSFVDGRYAELYEEALFLAAEQWGVRFFKFDFATFRATADPSRPRHVTYAEGVRRFKDILRRLRAAFPDIHVITHCGFARGEQSTVSGAAQPLSVDLSWLEVVDAMFPGDPHPIDISQSSLVRNIDLYQDRQVWALHQHGFPLHRIDDHGVLVGETNTCCYRGRTGFKRTCLGQLLRGGRRHLMYGSPEVLNASDIAFLKQASELSFEAASRGLMTAIVGEGEPGLAPWHGYLTGGGDAGLLYVVNPSSTSVQLSLPVTDLQRAQLLWHDGKALPVLQVQPDFLRLELAAEQCALIGIGDFASKAALPLDDGPALPGRMELLPLALTMDAEGALVAELELSESSDLLVVARRLEGEEYGIAEGLPARFGSAFASGEDGTLGEQQLQQDVTIELGQGGTAIEAVERIPDVPIWAGISWVANRYRGLNGKLALRIAQDREQPKRLLAEVYRLHAE